MGISEAISLGVPRKEIFLVTKLVPRFFSGDAPARQVATWLEELQVDYIDLVLLHQPDGFGGFGGCANGTAAACRANAWAQLSPFVASGVIRNLGVSNFGIKQVDALSALNLAPVTANQIQCVDAPTQCSRPDQRG